MPHLSGKLVLHRDATVTDNSLQDVLSSAPEAAVVVPPGKYTGKLDKTSPLAAFIRGYTGVPNYDDQARTIHKLYHRVMEAIHHRQAFQRLKDLKLVPSEISSISGSVFQQAFFSATSWSIYSGFEKVCV